MKIIRVLNLFTIMNRGGAETMVMNYYRNINRDKIQFDFLVHRFEKGAYDDEIIKMGGRIYHAMPISPLNIHKYKSFLKDFFKIHKNEYLIIHSHMSELGYYAVKEAKKQGIPIRICHAHNAPHIFNIKMFISNKIILRNYLKFMIKPYITHRFICGYEAGDWLYGKKYRDTFIMLNNAISIEDFKYNKAIEEEQKLKYGLSRKFIIGHIGRFCEQKNHKFLIDIFCEILSKKNNAVLVMIGSGENEDVIKNYVLQKGIEKNVIFLGTRSDVNKVIQMFDILLFPSLFEGLPVTLIEAQAAGLLCVISDTIPKQCIITNNVITESLKQNAVVWARAVLEKSETYKKNDTSNQIIKAGYDIKTSALKLEEFYINEYNKI